MASIFLAVAGVTLTFPEGTSPRLFYRIESDKVVVLAHFGRPLGRAIDRTNIAGARLERLGGGMRTNGIGVGGFCQGMFRYSELGDVWQATNCDSDVVVLDLVEGQPVVISPSDGEGFVDAVLTPGTTGEFSAP